MNQRLISEIGRTQRLDIINSLKRTKGMSVNELVEKMGMSYMGIKQHCITLHRDGYLGYLAAPAKNGQTGDGLSAYAPHARSFSCREPPVDAGFIESSRGHLRTERAGEVALQHFQKEDRGAESQGEGRDGRGTREMACARARW